MPFSPRTISWLVVFSAGLSVGTAIPKSDFSVPQVFLKKAHSYSAADSVLQTYYKYKHAGAKPPVKLVEAAKKQSGSVIATPLAFDGEYVCPVIVGGQQLYLDFDTGSSDLWVFSSLLPPNQSAGHAIYDPSNSKKSKLLQGETWSIEYEDGSSSSGLVYSDVVNIGGATATAQAVEAATSVAASFAGNTAADGLVGLSFDILNTVRPQKQATFFDNVKPTLKEKLFAADLKHAAAGAYDFGFINGSRHTGPVRYTPVDNSTGFWLFQAAGYSFGSSTSFTGNQGTSVADTGTSLLYVPASTASAYYAQISGVYVDSGLYLFPCSSTLPNFNTQIGNTAYTVPGTYLNYEQVGAIGSTEYCLGGLQSANGLPFNIYGDIFLKSVYAVFDQTQATPRLGFATKKLT